MLSEVRSYFIFIFILHFFILSQNSLAQLSGTKTIGGTTPDYTTIKAAIKNLNTLGVTAPGVTFLIRDGVYNEDSLLIATATSNATAPIVFKPDAGATVVINVTPPNTNYNFAIKIAATQYVTIDGSNNSTTSRDLTINSRGTSGQRGIWVSSASHYAVVKNCNVNAGQDIATPSTIVRCIDFLYVSGTGNDPDFILCENNLCRYGYIGIRLEGVNTGDVMESAVVRNNIVDSVASAGIYSLYQNNSLIYNNNINVLRGSSSFIYGISVGTTSFNVKVFNNKIHDINQLSNSGDNTYGIVCISTLGMNSIYNNFIWNINASTSGTGGVYGLYSQATNSTTPDTFAFNSVNLTGGSFSDRPSSAFYKASSTGPVYVYNNILQNTRTDGTIGIASAIYKASVTTVLTSDNNNLYVGFTFPGGQHQTGRIFNTTYATLEDWQAVNISDYSSIVENTPFVSATDLHIQTAVTTQLESGGVSVVGITNDIDGDLRNATTPDIGADEFGSASNTFQLSVDIAAGWNMVSTPGLNSPDQNVNTWWAFRDPGANVFRYSGGYQSVTAATPGTGYWMKHSGARTYNTGDEWPAGGIQIVPHDPLAGASGWNLFGGYELSVTAANVTTNPPGLQSGPIYKYSGGYQVATTLNPGYGYWMKLTAAGQIIIPETLSKDGKPVEYFPENWSKIVLIDATGINYTLYAVKGETDLNQYELPPAPPEGMFDIRYSSGRIAEDLNSSVKTIEMNGITYPLTVRVEGMDIRLMDETGKNVNVNLKSGEDVVISDGTINKLMVSGELIPAQYSLEQCYPNPFNPSTVIEFSLPENVGNVKLSIYNTLGEKVAELVNTALVAGKYQYQWNAQNVATGMYIYELRTDKFVAVKKMLLIK